MQIIQSMLLGGWSRLTVYSRHTILYLCTNWLFSLFSVSPAVILQLKDVLLALTVWDLGKKITRPYTAVEHWSLTTFWNQYLYSIFIWWRAVRHQEIVQWMWCSHDPQERRGKGYLYFVCVWEHNRIRISCTKSTWFENSRMSPFQIILLTHFFSVENSMNNNWGLSGGC